MLYLHILFRIKLFCPHSGDTVVIHVNGLGGEGDYSFYPNRRLWKREEEGLRLRRPRREAEAGKRNNVVDGAEREEKRQLEREVLVLICFYFYRRP